MTLRNKNSLKS